jgi:hypothetical protein
LPVRTEVEQRQGDRRVDRCNGDEGCSRASPFYIRLVFKMIPNDPKEHTCCAAQMFLNEGDAVVFRGANGPWKAGLEPETVFLWPLFA